MPEVQTSNGRSTPTRKAAKRAREVTSKVKAYLEGTGPRPSRELMNFLPIRRVIPQDVHSVLDYVDGSSVLSGAFISDEQVTKVASVALGAAMISISALSDYRLSVAKLIPIEVHEVLDHVWGLSVIAAPFILGYYKKDRIASLLHVAQGTISILVSLFTDYRAQKGVGGHLTA